MLHNREEAEDAVQEVYLKLWKIRDQLPDYKSIEGLAFRITSNHCLDLLRRRSTGWEVMEKEMHDRSLQETEDPAELLERKEQAELLQRMIDRLPEPQRSLVYFRHIEEKEYDEISEIMEMTENSIRVALSRARKEIRKMFVRKETS
jgi:RNA polymerase sigma-70 factor (ECF subfamily)